MELINSSAGQAEAVVAAGRARAQSIELVAKALCSVMILFPLRNCFYLILYTNFIFDNSSKMVRMQLV